MRTEPDPSVTTASPGSMAPEFQSLDRKAGGLLVNRWTHRPLRWLARLLIPKADESGISVSKPSDAGPGTLLVTPKTAHGSGAIVLIHGGGYVIGSPTEALGKAGMLARACGVPVLCPGYRLAPEHPFPAALDDCNLGFHWLVEHAAEHGIDPAKIVVGGISAGGGHAAALAQRLHDQAGPQPAAQLLIYPMLDDRPAARRELDGVRHRVWNNRSNLFGWTSHLGHAPGEPCADYAVPARRDDFSGLPPAWIGVGTCDLFLDEDREYGRRLADAGVDVSYVEVDGGIHGFDAAGSPLGQRFDEEMVEFTRRFTD